MRLSPFNEVTIPITLVNSGSDPILVMAHNFTIRERGEPLSAARRIRPVESQHSALKLASWMQLFPAVQQLRPGTTGTFHLTTFYHSPELFLWTNHGKYETNGSAFHIEFTFLMRQHEHNVDLKNLPTERQSITQNVSFTPGPANVLTSIVESPPNTDIQVGNTTAVYIRLRDVFRNLGAYAKFYRDYTASDNGHHDAHPSIVAVTSTTGSFSLEFQTTRTRLVASGSKINELVISVLVASLGSISIDIRLNGTSMRGSPVNLTAVPVHCLRPNEIPDETGLACVCHLGFYRSSNDECTACPGGTFSVTGSNDDSCQSCPDRFFSEPGSSECYPCPLVGVTCSQGKLRLQSDIWCEFCTNAMSSRSPARQRERIIERLTKQAESVTFFDCRNDEACIVNSTALTTECNKGYHGPLCDMCESGYFKDLNDRSCFSCANGPKNIGYSVVQFSILLAGIVGVAYANLDKRSKIASSPSDFEATMIVSLDEVILAFVDYLQMVSILTSLDINPFPGELTEVLRWSFLNPTSSKRFQCLTGLGVYHSSFVTLLFPLPLSLIIFVIQFIVCWIQRRQFPSREVLRKTTLPTLLRFLHFVHASVSGIALSAIGVYEKPIESVYRLSIDMSIKVGSGRFYVLQVFAGLVIAMYVLGFPLGVCIYFYRQFGKARKKCSRFVERLYSRFSYLLEGYRIEGGGYMWPHFATLRKVLLTFVVIYAKEPRQQMVFVTAIALGTYFVCATMRPHSAFMVTRVELVNTAAVWLTAALGALQHSLNERDASDSAYAVMIVAIIVQICVFGFVCIGAMVFFPYVFDEKYRMIVAWYARLRRLCRHRRLSRSRRSKCLACRTKRRKRAMQIAPLQAGHDDLSDEHGAFIINMRSLRTGQGRVLAEPSERRSKLREPLYKPRHWQQKPEEGASQHSRPGMVQSSDSVALTSTSTGPPLPRENRGVLRRRIRRSKLKEPRYKRRHWSQDPDTKSKEQSNVHGWKSFTYRKSPQTATSSGGRKKGQDLAYPSQLRSRGRKYKVRYQSKPTYHDGTKTSGSVRTKIPTQMAANEPMSR